MTAHQLCGGVSRSTLVSRLKPVAECPSVLGWAQLLYTRGWAALPTTDRHGRTHQACSDILSTIAQSVIAEGL